MSKINYVAYEEIYNGCWLEYRRIKPTGRWKVESGPYYVNRLSIEVKRFPFNRWVGEDDIVFRPERTREVVDCSCQP